MRSYFSKTFLPLFHTFNTKRSDEKQNNFFVRPYNCGPHNACICLAELAADSRDGLSLLDHISWLKDELHRGHHELAQVHQHLSLVHKQLAHTLRQAANNKDIAAYFNPAKKAPTLDGDDTQVGNTGEARVKAGSELSCMNENALEELLQRRLPPVYSGENLDKVFGVSSAGLPMESISSAFYTNIDRSSLDAGVSSNATPSELRDTLLLIQLAQQANRSQQLKSDTDYRPPKPGKDEPQQDLPNGDQLRKLQEYFADFVSVADFVSCFIKWSTYIGFKGVNLGIQQKSTMI